MASGTDRSRHRSGKNKKHRKRSRWSGTRKGSALSPSAA